MVDIDSMLDARQQAQPGFKKGGQPVTPFMGRSDIADKAVDDALEVPAEDRYYASERALEDLHDKVLDDPKTAVQAWKNKQAALEADASNDESKQGALQYGLRGQGMPMNMPGTDRPRERSGFFDPKVDENGHVLEDENGNIVWSDSWNDMTEEPGVDGPVGKAYLELHNQNNLAAQKLTGDMPSGIWTTGYPRGKRPDTSYITEAHKNDQFKESLTDIDGRMNAWYGANIHPEMTSKFLKAVFGDDETDAAVENAAAEEGPDDFEAPGIKHMKDTKRERADALKTLVDYTTMNKERVGQGAEIGAFLTGYDAAHGHDESGNVTSMDVDVDTSSYLEALLNKGYITPEQYKEARRAFRDGYDLSMYEDLKDDVETPNNGYGY